MGSLYRLLDQCAGIMITVAALSNHSDLNNTANVIKG